MAAGAHTQLRSQRLVQRTHTPGADTPVSKTRTPLTPPRFHSSRLERETNHLRVDCCLRLDSTAASQRVCVSVLKPKASGLVATTAPRSPFNTCSSPTTNDLPLLPSATSAEQPRRPVPKVNGASDYLNAGEWVETK